MRKRTSGIIVFFILSIIGSSVFAQSPQMSSGLAWLYSAQTSTGNWPEVDTSEYYSTTAALDAVYKIDPASPSYSLGMAWLTGEIVSPTDYLSRRIIGLKRTGGDVSAELEGLLLYRNPDGGWGGETAYLSNNLDTTLALQALKAANYPDLTVINTALAYITNTQNPDGGWGFYKDNASNIYMTAIVSATLQQFPQTPAIAAAVTKATAYLLTWQNSDGGYGNPSSTVYETALAYSALVAVSGDPTVPGNAVNSILASQLPNGSWNDDPYSTALALKALYLSENKPAPPPPASTTGSLMGTIVDAATNAPLAGVTAVLTTDPLVSTTTDTSGMFALYGISTGAQQITLSHTGYASVTITASISAGTFINLGKVPMTVHPTTGTVMGIVWNADRNAPFGGVTVQSTSGFQILQTLSAADGSYKITGVNPGTVTVGTPAGPAGEGIYWNVPVTGTLAAGGIFIYNPMMSKTHPPFVTLSAQTDKALYKKGDTVALTINIQNNRSIGYSALLKVRAIDPSGATEYETDQVVTLTAKTMLVQNLDFILPATAQGGFHPVTAEVHDASEKIGDTSVQFGLFKSQISVSPQLPDACSEGQNTLSFKLTNTGNYPVSTGLLDISLADPDGQMIATGSQPFTLDPSETTTLTYPISIPPVKFGTYTLSYTQSDETTSGQAKTVSIPNTVVISPVFDKPTYKVRDTANLMLSLKNTGKFNLDPSITASISVPDAGFTETKTPSPPPAPTGGEGVAGSATVMNYSVPLPATMTAGEHTATITLTLPSGSTTAQTTQFTIPESSLSVILSQTTTTAGSTISPAISNTGGVDTTAHYTLSLFDSRAAMIAEKINTGAIQAGASLPASLAIPFGAVDGSYNLIVNYKDITTGKNDIVTLPLTVAGVKGTLSVQTEKQSYLTTENITSLSTIANTGTAIGNGNLHLQVTTAAGSEKQKTWTSQYDFQQGVRNGVDTYGVNDWLIPDDDFNYTTINTDKWWHHGNVQLQSNRILLDSTEVDSRIGANWYFDGDFDVQVNFVSNMSYAGQGAELLIVAGKGDLAPVFSIRNSAQHGYSSSYRLNGIWYDWTSLGAGTYANSGTFRIVKSGTTITSYYWNGASWRQLLTRTRSEFDTNWYVALLMARFLNQPSSSAFDNFKVNSGRIVTKNETVDSVRLLPLNDNFDDGLINRDRWNIAGNDTPAEISGALHLVSKQPTATGGTYDSVAWRWALKDDIAIYAKFKNYSTIPNTSGNIGRFLMLAQSDDSMFYLCRYTNAGTGNSGERLYGFSAIDGEFSSNSISYASDEGKFRLRRVGSTGYDDYWDGANWVNIHSRTNISSSPVTVLLQTESQRNTPSVQADVDYYATDAGKYATSGTLYLKYDSLGSSHWKQIIYSSTEPLGTAMKFRTRTADSEADLANASWSDYITVSGSPIMSPKNRWIQVEATLETADPSVTPVLHDVTVTYGNNPGDVLWETDIPIDLATGGMFELTSATGTHGVEGKLYLQGTLTSSTGQAVATSEYPFYIIQGNTVLAYSTDKKIYRPGETITITGEVKNPASIEAGNLSLAMKRRVGDGTEETLYIETFNIPAGASHPFTATTTAQAEGNVTLVGTVTQNNSILAQVSDQYTVARPLLTAALTAPDTAGNEAFTVALTLNNTGTMDATTRVQIIDDAGQVIENKQIQIPAGETQVLQYTRQITSATTYTVTITGDLDQTLVKTVAYTGTAFGTSVSTKIVTDRISYNANQQVTLASTITNQSPDSSIENLSAWITVQDSQGQVLYTETAPIPQLMQGQIKTINTYWNTAVHPAGIYTANLVVSNGTTIAGTSTATFEILRTSQSDSGLGAGLRGAISASHKPLYYGDQVLTYTITNQGNEEISGSTLKVIVFNPDTQQIVQTYTSDFVLPQNATVTDTLTVPNSLLPFGAYVAVFQVASSTEAEPKTLASASFEVKPGIEIAKTIPDVKNVLVWVNDNCERHGAEGREHRAWSMEHGAEGIEAFSRELTRMDANEQKPGCLSLDLLDDSLKEAADSYHIVFDKKDFQKELRNPLYTDFIILGDQQPIEDHFAEELREQVFAGKGLITSLYNKEDLNKDLLGISVTGSLSADCRTHYDHEKESEHRHHDDCTTGNAIVEIIGSELGIQGTFPSSGKAVRVEAESPDEVIAWIAAAPKSESFHTPAFSHEGRGRKTSSSHQRGEHKGGKDPYPAIIQHQYGKGKTLFFAFDLAQSSRDIIPFTTLLAQSLNFVHAPLDPSSLRPGRLVPVQITLKSLGAAFDLRVNEIYPHETTIYDPETGTWITDNPWVQTVELASNQTATILFYARPPDEAGSFQFKTEAGYLESGEYISYQTVENQITVVKSTAEVLTETISGLQALALKGREASARHKAVRSLHNVQTRVILTRSDRKAVIADLRKAANALVKITSADVANIRDAVDRLLMFWEAEWYLSGQ